MESSGQLCASGCRYGKPIEDGGLCLLVLERMKDEMRLSVRRFQRGVQLEKCSVDPRAP